MKKERFLSKSDAHYLVKDAEKILSQDRRRLLCQGLTLGGIMMLTGCDISDNADVEMCCRGCPDLMIGFKGSCSANTIWHRNIPLLI